MQSGPYPHKKNRRENGWTLSWKYSFKEHLRENCYCLLITKKDTAFIHQGLPMDINSCLCCSKLPSSHIQADIHVWFMYDSCMMCDSKLSLFSEGANSSTFVKADIGKGAVSISDSCQSILDWDLSFLGLGIWHSVSLVPSTEGCPEEQADKSERRFIPPDLDRKTKELPQLIDPSEIVAIEFEFII